MTDNRDPRQDPRKGDQLRDETGRLMTVNACYHLPQRPKQWQVSYTATPGGHGCVCGLSNWRRYYKRAEVLHLQQDPADMGEKEGSLCSRSIAELKAAISEQWKNLPAGAAALKIISAIETKETPVKQWRMAEILSLLDTPELTPEAVAALAILTQSNFAIFRASAEFIDDDNQRHRLSSEAFQRVQDADTVLHPVTGVEIAQASARVVPLFELETSLFC